MSRIRECPEELIANVVEAVIVGFAVSAILRALLPKDRTL
jgi:hypothetical protein